MGDQLTPMGEGKIFSLPLDFRTPNWYTTPMTITNYTKPVTLIRLRHPDHPTIVEFAFTPRYARWTMLKYNPGKGHTASDAWGRYCETDLFKPLKFDSVSHGATDLYYADIERIVGHLALNGWSVAENRKYTGPTGYYECNAANAAEAEDLVLF